MARPPATIQEQIVANCRPQPAVPALLVLVFTLMFATSLRAGPGDVTWATWVVVAGVLVSCGLAIAAGFCSFFPPLAWIAVILVGIDALGRVPGAAYPRGAAVVGLVATLLMLMLQAWRVRTARFVPTIEDQPRAD